MGQLHDELKQAAEEVLSSLGLPQEYQRRLLQLLENVVVGNYTEGDVREVIELTEVDGGEA